MDSTENRFNRMELMFGEFRDKFSALMGALRGEDGQGGVLSDIKEDLSELKVSIHHLDEKQTTMVTQMISDRAQTEKALSMMRADVNQIGHIARNASVKADEVKEELRDHLDVYREEMKTRVAEKNEKKRFNVNTLVAVAAVIVAVVIPLITR